MSSKSKGTNAERELIHLFWSHGFACFRAAGSGSMKYPCPDIIAGNNLRRLGLECKATKQRSQYFSVQEIDDLRAFCTLFGCESWVGVRFDRDAWHFFSLEDLNRSEGSYHISHEEAKRCGLSFLQLIDKS